MLFEHTIGTATPENYDGKNSSLEIESYYQCSPLMIFGVIDRGTSGAMGAMATQIIKIIFVLSVELVHAPSTEALVNYCCHNLN